ncbi:MACPF domain-containing protein [Carex littledalei]|uniref:MACPF domain-containing protein n=1 Tax=Carex littledalei TaxID=544730 RepID=A0A833QQN3_9POAL|nr:MACPF domain-containing protein [Carex littledalei]
MPVKYDPSWSTDAEETAFIVTGVQLHVQTYGFTSVLHLRLLYTEVQGYTISQSKWARSPSHFAGKSSFLSTSFTGSSSVLDREKNENQILNVDSGVFNINPPVPVGTLKLLNTDLLEAYKLIPNTPVNKKIDPPAVYKMNLVAE